jgi:hypothetical protein
MDGIPQLLGTMALDAMSFTPERRGKLRRHFLHFTCTSAVFQTQSIVVSWPAADAIVSGFDAVRNSWEAGAVVRFAMQLPVSKLPAFKLSTISPPQANSCLASVMIVGTRVAPLVLLFRCPCSVNPKDVASTAGKSI